MKKRVLLIIYLSCMLSGCSMKIVELGPATPVEVETEKEETRETKSRMVETKEEKSNYANITYDKFVPYRRKMLEGKIYSAKDGEFVKDGALRFLINGIYVKDCMIEKNASTFEYYWADSNGFLYQQINYYPGTTSVRSLDYDNNNKGALVLAIVNSLYEDTYGENYSWIVHRSGNYPEHLSTKGGVWNFEAEGISTKVHYESAIPDIEIELSLRERDNTEVWNTAKELAIQIAELYFERDSWNTAWDMIDFSNEKTQRITAKGYYGDVEIAYYSAIHGNSINITAKKR